jgi:FkbM family methyltransferase
MARVSILDEVLGESRIVVVDGGARNGTLELPKLAPYCWVYGFEPNQVEFEKLMTGHTDLSRVAGVTSPAYAKIIYSNYALSDYTGAGTLYITAGPGACSTLKPNQRIVSRYVEDYSRSFDVIGEMAVRCITLPAAMKHFGVETIDYVKLDTQGNELDILLASEPLLSNGISVIKMEVEFVCLYERQKLFSDSEVELRRRGFELLDLSVTDEHRIARVSKRLDGRRSLVWGDAFFVKELGREASRERILKQAIVLMGLGYIDYGFSVIRGVPGIEEAVVSRLHGYYAEGRGLTMKERVHRRVRSGFYAVRSLYGRLMRL